MASLNKTTIEISDGEVKQALGKLAARLADMTPFMDQIGAALVTSTRLRFNAQHDPDGKPWAPLSLRTLARKKKAGREGILQWAGHLKSSLTHQASANGVEVGTNVPYGAIHQLGGIIQRYAHGMEIRLRKVKNAAGNLVTRFAKMKHKRVQTRRVEIGEHAIHIPARPFLGVSASDKPAIIAVLSRGLGEGVSA